MKLYTGSFKYTVTDLDTRKQLIEDGMDPSNMIYQDTYINTNGHSYEYMKEYIAADLQSMARWISENLGAITYAFKIGTIESLEMED